MAEGGWGSGTWGEAGWGMSVYYRDAAETATTSDTEAVAGSVFNSAIVEVGEGIDNIATTPTFFVGVEEEAAISSVVQVGSSTLGVSVSEAATVSDANSAQQVFACDIAEGAVTLPWYFGTNFAAQQVFATAVSETATGADALDANFAYFANADESATASETNSAQHVMPVSVSESATGTDAMAVKQVFDSRVSESAVASVEAVVAASIFYAYLVAGATIADTLTARFLWEPIDDNQDPNWQNINDGQTQSWTPVQTV
jgi:hypothetical protein